MNTPIITEQLWGRGVQCPFDDVIDVRSPGEYVADHIPGALNFPVLDDAEHAEVGTVYHQEGAFIARKVGAAYVSSNIGRHLREYFAGKSKEYRPLVYCWRGGQRSASLATVLSQVGWRVALLRGGYKTYRRHVRRELEALPRMFSYRLLAGATGTAKTRLLHALAARGAQVLDLEGLARHRGSVLGREGPQPTQKHFDSLLLAALDQFNPAVPIWIEAESNRIGDLYLPPALWAMMRASDGVVVQMPIVARVRHLLAEYSHLLADGEGLKTRLRLLTTRRGARQIVQWERLIDYAEWDALVTSLLAVHYDPAYLESARRCHPHITGSIQLGNESSDSIEALVGELLRPSVS